MRKISMSLATVAAVTALTTGLAPSAHAVTGTLYITQDGQTKTYPNPAIKTCFGSDPAKGQVTFANKTDKLAFVMSDPKCGPGSHVEYVRTGQTSTWPAGYAVIYAN
ncbi:hypothetical protein [Nocardia fluminea]|uniref:hypothetical protein n=1 Tax=Nocardia fluminea TaxID=134984 RepID=UPI00364D2A0E